jgi:hypothetical protein
MLCLVYNFIQYLRLIRIGEGFKDTLEVLSAYLLWKKPPECVFEMEKVLNRISGNIGFKKEFDYKGVSKYLYRKH